MKFSNYLNELAKISKIMVGFTFDDRYFINLRKHLTEIFFNNQVEGYTEVEDPHITIAIIPGTVLKDKLVREINKIKADFRFNPKHLKVFKGLNTPFDYVTIEYKNSVNFQKSFKDIADDFEVVMFPEGSKPHISLYKIPKGELSDDVIDMIQSFHTKLPVIEPEATALYNSNEVVEYQK
jgi:hypothetical protein